MGALDHAEIGELERRAGGRVVRREDETVLSLDVAVVNPARIEPLDGDQELMEHADPVLNRKLGVILVHVIREIAGRLFENEVVHVVGKVGLEAVRLEWRKRLGRGHAPLVAIAMAQRVNDLDRVHNKGMTATLGERVDLGGRSAEGLHAVLEQALDGDAAPLREPCGARDGQVGGIDNSICALVEDARTNQLHS